MAESKGFECSVVTPERVVIECRARFVALPAHDGLWEAASETADDLAVVNAWINRLADVD